MKTSGACLPVLVLALVALAGVAHADPPAVEHFAMGRFGDVTVYRPAAKPKGVVLFISGDGGWHLGVVGMAKHLVDAGDVVVGIDVRRYRTAINAPTVDCRYYAADFEELAHAVQRRLALDEYHVPILAGYSSGATLAYAVMVQSPRGTWAGVFTFGFCPDLDFVQRPCRGSGLEFDMQGTAAKPKGLVYRPAAGNTTPWFLLQGEIDQVCEPAATRRFAAATGHATLVSLPGVGHGFGVERHWLPQFLQVRQDLESPPKAVAPTPNALALPLHEVPAARVGAAAPRGARDTLAVLLTGDGGWAGLDQDVSAALAARGIPVVALNSLKYFWHARTPDEAARDLLHIVQVYGAKWARHDVLLIGYSFGADVLPFLYRRLPAEVQDRVRSISLLGLSDNATFEFHLSDWIPGNSGDGYPTVPEIAALRGARVLCLYGADEKHTACPSLHGPAVHVEELAGGHHFDGDYAALAQRIIDYADLAGS
ncbi:MAG: hypothetical protein CMLOHMNK_03163 [Steroidobacteraceae bacterium]|nr:hypothetical protein [Steroidobacteraceae bacterium]